MKILLSSPRISGVGGIAHHVRTLARKLRDKGFVVDVLSAEYLKIPSLKNLANPLYGLLSYLKTVTKEYDIVHGHNLPSLPAILSSSGGKILTLHGLYSKQIRLLHGQQLGYMAEVVEKKFLRKLDAITTVSMEALKYYEGLGLKVEHIPNAIDLLDLPKDSERICSPQITYLGRLSYEKGVDLLIETAARYGLRGLVIAGDGPLRRFFEKAHEKKLLTYLGPLPRWRALRVLAGSDAAILPSRQEGISTFLLEAMALKIPVIASKVGGNIEIIQENVEGILIEPDAGEIAKAARNVLTKTIPVDKMIDKAYNRILTQYEWNTVLKKYLNVYARILDLKRF
ncbi:MAG: glycosyltransferase family 4 protein [Nitrososphaerota archaeon]